MKRSGVEVYSKPLHTLRKSCLTDWAGKFPIHCVQEWAGHASITTTQTYYLKVQDHDYEKAAASSFWGNGTENGTENGKNSSNGQRQGTIKEPQPADR